MHVKWLEIDYVNRIFVYFFNNIFQFWIFYFCQASLFNNAAEFVSDSRINSPWMAQSKTRFEWIPIYQRNLLILKRIVTDSRPGRMVARPCAKQCRQLFGRTMEFPLPESTRNVLAEHTGRRRLPVFRQNQTVGHHKSSAFTQIIMAPIGSTWPEHMF